MFSGFRQCSCVWASIRPNPLLFYYRYSAIYYDIIIFIIFYHNLLVLFIPARSFLGAHAFLCQATWLCCF